MLLCIFWDMNYMTYESTFFCRKNPGLQDSFIALSSLPSQSHWLVRSVESGVPSPSSEAQSFVDDFAVQGPFSRRSFITPKSRRHGRLAARTALGQGWVGMPGLEAVYLQSPRQSPGAAWTQERWSNDVEAEHGEFWWHERHPAETNEIAPLQAQLRNGREGLTKSGLRERIGQAQGTQNEWSFASVAKCRMEKGDKGGREGERTVAKFFPPKRDS